MDLIYIMDWICLVVTIVMFLCGVPPCVTMYKTNSTKNVPYIFFLLNVISCSGMFHYGMLVGNSTVTFINGFGGILQIFYILTYLYIVEYKSQSLLMLCGMILYICGLYWYLFNIVDPKDFAPTLGLCSSTVITIIVVLPLFEIISNIRNKNSDGMPTVMLLGGLSCGCSWLVYGLLLQDPNIYRPNIPGVVIGFMKLACIATFSKTGEHMTIEKTVKKVQ